MWWNWQIVRGRSSYEIHDHKSGKYEQLFAGLWLHAPRRWPKRLRFLCIINPTRNVRNGTRKTWRSSRITHLGHLLLDIHDSRDLYQPKVKKHITRNTVSQESARKKFSTFYIKSNHHLHQMHFFLIKQEFEFLMITSVMIKVYEYPRFRYA